MDQAPIANAVVTFNKDCNLLIDKKVEKIEKIITNPTHNMKAWLEYIENNSKAYLNEILKNPISLDNNNISLMLGTLDTPITYLENKDSVKECLVDVLNTLRKIKKKMKIFVKPHVISNPQIFNEILSKYEDLPIILNYLHPAVLANYSKISICNYWSYSQPHAMAQGAFVIEYTQYSKEALNLTNGQSYMPQYVDYFINKDQEKLENKINLCLSKKKNPKSIGSANLSLLKRIYGN
ncbi:MAG: hypothetical protein CBE11_03815 [Rickettsiales bacterium TMED251]|nr:MAG: hypothetical protein CBE11_03815 [Rickettsiales bacterium TMED251]